MARLLPIPLARPTIISVLLFFSFLLPSFAGKSGSFVRSIPHEDLGIKEKLSTFRLYWHDFVSGRNPTSVPVTKPRIKSTTLFGMVNMIDDPITEGPEFSSKLVGRAQGFYASASQEQIALLMAMNFAFMEGKYNGSTITVLGRNTVFSKVREMPVIGGTGAFRFARGYVEARTHSLDVNTGDAIVQYTFYVKHY
ncbi:hypothetical protein Nepgr_012121 [Nepenthes gracilis]|uniref:Dirigent protein n=1 Tax=Nepenthes gracilis TaxID=150966 RepID=A0AAD3SF85_NEPGR|nr:hypothetical protein Nepgr_012121 [Nepenthes gracilis]